MNEIIGVATRRPKRLGQRWKVYTLEVHAGEHASTCDNQDCDGEAKPTTLLAQGWSYDRTMFRAAKKMAELLITRWQLARSEELGG